MEIFMHAKDYRGQDVTGWLMSEKLDGVRAMWDGEKFLSRSGKVFNAPDWFKETLPNVRLDGELFVTRNWGAARTSGMVRKKKLIDSDWEEIEFHVFDAPDMEGSFFDRSKKIAKLLMGSRIAMIVFQYPVTKEKLIRFYDQVKALGGEAVMLKSADCGYEIGRSKNHLKYFGEPMN